MFVKGRGHRSLCYCCLPPFLIRFVTFSDIKQINKISQQAHGTSVMVQTDLHTTLRTLFSPNFSTSHFTVLLYGINNLW